MNLWKSYLRWRHSHGFGVHSPYAFSFVENVVRPGCYGFYSYEDALGYLEDDEIHHHRLIRLIEFFIRLTFFLKSRRIICLSDEGKSNDYISRASDIAARSLKLEIILSSGKNLRLMEGDLLIISPEENNLSTLDKAVNEAVTRGVAVCSVRPGKELRNLMERSLERGLLINSPYMMILIPRREMAYVAYDMKIAL